ncbi:MAG: dTMP kinase [Planctomycetes bacterium]|nr:dTMP kinase [Planctomycetota bacterium]
MPGKFIVFEGPDGCGKSTMVEAARRHFKVKGVAATFVQDPGGTDIGQQIRKILLDKHNDAMCPMTELMLYVASRAQLVAEIIRPALERGEVVVSDRFTASTLAYQGVAGSVPEDKLKEMVKFSADGLEPDHVILLDVPAEIGLERVGSSKDRMELKGLVFFEEVRQRYLGFADGMPEDKVSVLDASRSVLEVQREMLDILDDVTA